MYTYQCQPKCRVDLLDSYVSSTYRRYRVRRVQLTFGSTTHSFSVCSYSTNTWSTVLEISCPSWPQGIRFSYFSNYQLCKISEISGFESRKCKASSITHFAIRSGKHAQLGIVSEIYHRVG